ncbi:hypothetical protein [Alicyclobacillus sp.]|uniref:hypothetical protein n=1 Tax=Alicyclobacillus sp. TaxID=61169 RepID=UPI0025BE2AC5|nr:hypothetical protein [Alicyclobacillus sp.]MCL6516637.1 hypothetical protein [Alicyclobacillus sp.]
MLQQTHRGHPPGFWRTLWRLRRGPGAVLELLDIPLDLAIRRSRGTAGWVTALGLLAVCIARPDLWVAPQRVLHLPPHAGPAVLAAVWVVFAIGLAAAVYGLLRLYTLVAHVMATSVFKARGQRLRLLNVECTALALAAPAVVGVALTRWAPVLGWTVAALSALAGLWCMAVGCGAVFHRSAPAGLWLWSGATLVTVFVLGIGAIAVAAALGVLSLFILVFLRVFAQHGS